MTDHNHPTAAASETNPGNRGTNPAPHQPKLPLGVGAVIGQSFSILFRNFFRVVLIGLVPSFLGYLIPVALLALVGFGMPDTLQQMQQQPGNAAASVVIGGVVFGLFQIAVFAFIAALLAQLTYDSKLGRPVKLRRYLGPGLSAVPAIVLLAIAIYLLLMVISLPIFLLSALLGPIAFLIILAMPVFNLWIMAVFCVVAPAVVIERIGLRGLGRSMALTKNYRWPIVGTLLLTFICFIGVFLLGSFIMALLVGTITFVGEPGGILSVIAGGIIPILLYAFISTVGIGLIGIVIALVYARLREIKEGISVDQIAAVFD